MIILHSYIVIIFCVVVFVSVFTCFIIIQLYNHAIDLKITLDD